MLLKLKQVLISHHCFFVLSLVFMVSLVTFFTTPDANMMYKSPIVFYNDSVDPIDIKMMSRESKHIDMNGTEPTPVAGVTGPKAANNRNASSSRDVAQTKLPSLNNLTHNSSQKLVAASPHEPVISKVLKSNKTSNSASVTGKKQTKTESNQKNPKTKSTSNKKRDETSSANTLKTKTTGDTREGLLLTSASLRTSTCKCPKISDEQEGQAILQAELRKMDPKYNVTGAESLARHHPNLPLGILSRPKRCSLMPDVASIRWAGPYWQEFVGANGKRLLLYSAAYDNRTVGDVASKGGVVRVLVMSEGPLTQPPPCHLWYGHQLAPASAKAIRTEHVDYQSEAKNRLLPYLLTYPAPLAGAGTGRPQPPVAVSLVGTSCKGATTLLQVNGQHISQTKQPVYQRPQELSGLAEVGVCGPALFYYQEDFSVRLVEWLELLKALGVSKVFLYVTDVHPNVEKVLAHYDQQGFVGLTYFSYPLPYVDEPLLRRYWTRRRRPHIFAMENVYFTDCLLRNMHRLRFLGHFDPDELPLLGQHASLPQLVQHLLDVNKGKPRPGFSLPWSYFPFGIENQEASADVDAIARNTSQKYFTTRCPKFDKSTSPPHDPNHHRATNDAHTGQNSSSHDPDKGSKSSNRKPVLAQNGTGIGHGRDAGCARSGAPPSSLFTILVNDRSLVRDNNTIHKNVKSILDTSLAMAAYSHSVLLCASGEKCKERSLQLSRDLAVTGHFKDRCEAATCSDLQRTVQAPALGRLRPAVVPRVLHALADLRLLV